jgi:hypothetical protein
MAKLSESDMQMTAALILAGAHMPLNLDEIHEMFARAGYDVTLADIVTTLEQGPFSKIGRRWKIHG